MRNIAVVLSGGAGTRFGENVPKQYQMIAQKPVLVYTLEQLQRCEQIDHIIVTACPDWSMQILSWKEQFALTKIRAVAPAGPDRQSSILSGLLAAEPYSAGEEDNVIIQDAVRPLASGDLLLRLIASLQEAACVMPVLPVTDTVYTSRDGQWADGLLERSAVYAGQAPEAFRYRPYLRLYRRTPPETLSAMSGSCQLPCSEGWKVKMIPGEQENIKVTYPGDLEICEKLLQKRGELD